MGKEVKNITDELPFDIPNNWSWVRLKSISIIFAGGTPDRGTSEYWNGDIPWLKISDLTSSNKYVEKATEFITDKGMNNSSAKIMKKGTILYSIFATIGEVRILNFDATCNQAIAGIVTLDSSVDDYLYEYLVNLKNFMMSISKGCAQFNINQKILKDALIALPPTKEQHRIVKRLQDIEPLIYKYERQEQQLSILESTFEEKLKASILQYAIEGKLVKQDTSDEPASVLLEHIKAEKEKLIKEGKIKRDKNESEIIIGDDKNYYAQYGIKVPSNWCLCNLLSISTKIVDGNHNPPKGIDQITEYKMLSSLNIDNNGLINLNSVRYLTKEQFIEENKRTNIQLNDVLLTTVGSLGRCFVLNQSIPICFQRSVSVITTLINPHFLRLFFLTPSFQKYMQRNAKGTAQKGFYLNQLSNSLVAFPSLKKQGLIVSLICKLFNFIC